MGNDGELYEGLKKAKNDKKTENIKFLHNILVPILLGEKSGKGVTRFKKDYDYKYAVCSFDSEISESNFDEKKGIVLNCTIPINRISNFRGPIQIKPFSDYAYVEHTDADGKTNVQLIGIKFDISSKKENEDNNESDNSSDEETDEVTDTKKSSNSNERRLQNDISISEPNFLILDSKLHAFICPDIPVLVIKDYNDGIQFGGLSKTGKKFLFLLYGYLSNGYDFSKEELTLADYTTEEIAFYLTVIDNLEKDDSKKLRVKCTIPIGSPINDKQTIEIDCKGSKLRSINNTDLILNWNWKENNEFDNLIVKWPYSSTGKKHIFYYDVQGLSLKNDDYGCFENKFYFYLYVYDLKAEPQISFNLPLEYPRNSVAECKLFDSKTFKCMIDLRLKKISKNSKIIISNELGEYLPNQEKNIVLFKMRNNSNTIDFVLPVKEDCGDMVLVGALKDVGYSYIQVIFIIIGCFTLFILIIVGIILCITYEITHRDTKQTYHKQVDESGAPNPDVNKTLGATNNPEKK